MIQVPFSIVQSGPGCSWFFLLFFLIFRPVCSIIVLNLSAIAGAFSRITAHSQKQWTVVTTKITLDTRIDDKGRFRQKLIGSKTEFDTGRIDSVFNCGRPKVNTRWLRLILVGSIKVSFKSPVILIFVFLLDFIICSVLSDRTGLPCGQDSDNMVAIYGCYLFSLWDIHRIRADWQTKLRFNPQAFKWTMESSISGPRC